MKVMHKIYMASLIIILLMLFNTNYIFSASPPSVSGPGSPPPPPGQSPEAIKNILSNLTGDNYDLLNLEDMPTFKTAFKIDGTETTQLGGTVSDKLGNIYITGGFSGSLSFNTQPNTTLISTGGYDVFIAKYDASGNCLWVRNAEGNSNIADSLSIDGGVSIVVDKSGNIYVGGVFVNTLSFMDSQSNNIKTLSSDDATLANFELFIAKYNTDGDLLWVKGGNSGSHGDAATLNKGLNAVSSIVLDAEDLPYIGGRFSGSNFLGTQVGLEEDGDFFLAALNPDNGEVVWAEILGTENEDAVISLALDIYGYINALGSMNKGSIAFPTNPETILTNENDKTDTFIAKFDVNGNCLWADQIGGDEQILGVDIAADTLGNIFVAGSFKGSATFAGSNIELKATGSYGDGYLAKYDFNGNALWARRFGDEVFSMSSRIAVDEIGNSFVFGSFTDNIVFNSESPGSEITLTSGSYVDMFIANYDSAGTFKWVKKIDDNGFGGISQLSPASIPVRNNPLQLTYNNNNGGELLLGGDFNSQLFLDGTTLTAENDSRNSFIAKLSLTGNATGISSFNTLPVSFSLSQNYPNPFNPSTIINFQLPEKTNVNLKIYDMLGREVKTLVNDVKPAGIYNVSFNAAGLSSGIYYYSINTPQFSQAKKMILVK